jgi:hypothetical protein
MPRLATGDVDDLSPAVASQLNNSAFALISKVPIGDPVDSRRKPKFSERHFPSAFNVICPVHSPRKK